MGTKVVLISGGTEGIGKGAVLQLLKEGYFVSTFSRNKKNIINLENLAKKNNLWNKLLVLNGDITNQNDLENIIYKTITKFKNIDILINNAGIGYYTECDKVNIKKYKEMIETNILGVISLTKLVVPYMKKNKRGLIINISSISGKMSQSNGEFYSSTKFALMGYSQGIRDELKKYGIKVSTVCPGMVKTKFFDQKEIENIKKRWNIKIVKTLKVEDVTKVISLICNQSINCDIQDITILPF